MEHKKRNLVPAFIGVAAVWFGAHIGPGFASGTSMTTFFLQYGAIGLILPLISMAIVAGVIYCSVEYARLNKTTNFKEYAAKLYGPANKIMGPLHDISYLLAIICAAGLCLSGLASVLEAHLGLPYWGGVILSIAATILLAMFGSKVVSKSSAYMMYLIFVVLGLIVVMSAVFGDHDLGGSIANSAANAKVPSVGAAVYKAIIYACLQCGAVLYVIPVTDTLTSRSDSKKVAAVGWVLNALMMVAVTLTVFSYTNVYDIVGESLPIYSILTRLGFGWLTWLYVALFALAALTSLVGVSFSGVVRYSPLIGFIKNQKAKNVFIMVVFLGLASCGAAFGFKAIMNTGNTIWGYLNIPVFLIPAYTVTRYKISRKYLEKQGSCAETGEKP